MEPSFEPDPHVLREASKVLDADRVRDLDILLRWKHGGCLTGNRDGRPAIADLGSYEDLVVRDVWRTIPHGSSSWMTAFNAILNYHKGQNDGC